MLDGLQGRSPNSGEWSDADTAQPRPTGWRPLKAYARCAKAPGGDARRCGGDDERMVDVDEDAFGRLVEAALDSIPPRLRRMMRNVAVVVEDEGVSPNLLGLYHGVPLTQRTTGYAGVLPDRITIFRRPLLRDHRTRTELRRQIRATVVHEIAHFFGLDERHIRRLGF